MSQCIELFRHAVADGMASVSMPQHTAINLLAEIDVLREQLDRALARCTLADTAACGNCKLGGRWVEINDACDVHGDVGW